MESLLLGGSRPNRANLLISEAAVATAGGGAALPFLRRRIAACLSQPTVLLGGSSPNRANFLISAEYRDQVQTGARVAISRLLGYQLIQV